MKNEAFMVMIRNATQHLRCGGNLIRFRTFDNIVRFIIKDIIFDLHCSHH